MDRIVSPNVTKLILHDRENWFYKSFAGGELIEGFSPNLKIIDCCISKIEKLPELSLGLEEFNCYGTRFIEFPVLPLNLKKFRYSGDALQFDLSPNLERFECIDHSLQRITRFPLTLKILSLHCINLEELPDLPPNLEELYCSGGKLKKLPELPSSLQYLQLWRTGLRWLPKLPSDIIKLRYESIDLQRWRKICAFYERRLAKKAIRKWKEFSRKRKQRVFVF